MKIENLKKFKIFYIIMITLIILCSLIYYFGYYRNLPQYADKNSPEYTANMFFSKIKNSKPEERNGEEICDMIYFKGTSGFVDFEEMMKVYYSNLVIDKYKLKSKTKIDDDLYEFTIFVKPTFGIRIINNVREDSTKGGISNFFVMKMDGEWKIIIGIQNIPDSKLQQHEHLHKRLIARRVDAEKNDVVLMGDSGF